MRAGLRTQRGIAAAFGAVALTAGLSGCMSGETDDGPSGPNGYSLGATLGDGVEAWYDLSEGTAMTDVILTQDGRSEPIGVCLGGGATVCIAGDVATQPYVTFFGPTQPGRTELTWNGAPVEMTRLEGVDETTNQVYVAAPPAADPAALAFSFVVYDEAGTAIYQQ